LTGADQARNATVLVVPWLGTGAVFSYTAIADAFTAISPDLSAEGEPDDERYSNDGQNDGYERTSAPCRKALLGYRDTVVSMGHLCPSCQTFAPQRFDAVCQNRNHAPREKVFIRSPRRRRKAAPAAR
jgi:hypothetical protein